MDESVRYSSSRILAASAVILVVGGCVDELPPIEETASLRVQLLSPADVGTEEEPLPDTVSTANVYVTAVDANGEDDLSFNGTIDVYVYYLGSLTPTLESGTSWTTLEVTDGRSGNIDIDLPRLFGQAYLWFEHEEGDAPTYATGTSPRFWFRYPYLEDVSRPVDEEALDAMESSPLEHKQMDVRGSRYGDAGRLVVTGIYSQGYTVSDVECQDASGTPPCVTGDYDHLYVYSYSRPEDHDGRLLHVGSVLYRITGAIAEFNGLTEVSFPDGYASDTAIHAEMVPDPIVIQPGWLSSRIEMERAESALVAIDDATLCPLDDDWDTYSQWKLDVGNGCGSNSINIITKGQVPDFDALNYVPAHEGETIPRVVGTLRPINIGSFNVWLVYPRSIDDLTLPAS